MEVDIRLRLFAIGKRGSLWEGVVTLLSRSSDRHSRQRNKEGKCISPIACYHVTRTANIYLKT